MDTPKQTPTKWWPRFLAAFVAVQMGLGLIIGFAVGWILYDSIAAAIGLVMQ